MFASWMSSAIAAVFFQGSKAASWQMANGPEAAVAVLFHLESVSTAAPPACYTLPLTASKLLMKSSKTF